MATNGYRPRNSEYQYTGASDLGAAPMKTCTIFGNMQSDSTAEQYPTVTLCNDCVEQDALAQEESQIVSQAIYDDSFGDSCDWCGTTADEESASE
jgi:hypothetical protein